MTNTFDKILEFENGLLTDPEIVLLFTELVETGDIWKLPPSYGDMAAFLIEGNKLNTKQNTRLN